jgi:hypothetical protein
MGLPGQSQSIPYGPTANAATYQTVKEFIIGNLKDYFNEKEDKLRFIPKSNPNLIIKGYKAIKPNRNGQLHVPQTAAANDAGGHVFIGLPPKVSHSCTWQVKNLDYELRLCKKAIYQLCTCLVKF